jgi:hypothetical protein
MNKTRKNKNKNIRICILRDGIGNKLLFLLNVLHQYGKLYTIYFVEKHSHHFDPPLRTGFPSIPNLISWSEYDEYKKNGIKEIEYSNSFMMKEAGLHSPPSFLQMNPSYTYLLKKYDFKNGIFIHLRYGDKFQWNYTKLKKKDPHLYILLKPSYYADAITQFEPGPIYIFSDTTFVKCLLDDTIKDAIFAEENSYETFFCLTHCKKLILSDSTFGIAAAYLNVNPALKIVAPGYMNDATSIDKIINTPFHYRYNTYIVKNRSYLVPKSIHVYKQIKDRCMK